MFKVDAFFVISYINIHLHNNINLSLCHEERRLHIAAVKKRFCELSNIKGITYANIYSKTLKAIANNYNVYIATQEYVISTMRQH